MNGGMMQEVETALEEAKLAQQHWAGQVLRQRLRAIRKVASRIAESHWALLKVLPRPNATAAEKLASEVLPLADACRHTAKIGRQTLAPRSHNTFGGAWWMGRVGVHTLREPWGSILILGPSNYPLFLPGVQMVQALAAGNAVLVKPAPGCSQVLERFKACLAEAGVPPDIVQILPSSVEAAQHAMHLGVDKVVLTGSVHTGRAVARQLADSLTPATLELGGCDAVFVLPQADIARAVNAIAFALCLNGGATCIAPRRIFVTPAHQPILADALRRKLSTAPTDFQVPHAARQATCRAVERALAQGASWIFGELPSNTDSNQMQPIVLGDVSPDMEVAQSDLFAPITSILTVPDMPQALTANQRCPYRLGVAIFGPPTYAEHWARQVDAGCVVVNDLIAPTADPRVAFGGRDHSGWGVTRGAEGLWEMTRPKTICLRRGNWLPHLDRRQAGDEKLLGELLQLFHAESWRIRFNALQQLVRSGMPRLRKDQRSDDVNSGRPELEVRDAHEET